MISSDFYYKKTMGFILENHAQKREYIEFFIQKCYNSWDITRQY
ncbi:hypothetical protein CLOBOL_04042 [Enterocloster bolteae ATCC BAA-613]|uniref:Uncharacterized protein n=1 Tax=Enterocloster bolteae (strain ATCC BAA-613 / DSM 15670 / CCUG 46953 / JCM 12243 / WAL 16351) TaxID=411902 RepID=A8RUK0_ENTBW|nr:hypothetical protein CLOBOL_04042 [Enterocloster bolteae ATCC BAA-613]